MLKILVYRETPFPRYRLVSEGLGRSFSIFTKNLVFVRNIPQRRMSCARMSSSNIVSYLIIEDRLHQKQAICVNMFFVRFVQDFKTRSVVDFSNNFTINPMKRNANSIAFRQLAINLVILLKMQNCPSKPDKLPANASDV